MNQRMNLQQIGPLLFVVLLFAALGLWVVVSRGTPLSLAPLPDAKTADRTSGAAFDAAEAADLSAARWLAMARFYEMNGMLTRDPFDYEEASKNQAARWQAMARYYETNGKLTRDPFDYEEAAEISAYRWEAMAKAYERMGLLNK